jgi:drug/metabolite transporter superfamily protein YnfA
VTAEFRHPQHIQLKRFTVSIKIENTERGLLLAIAALLAVAVLGPEVMQPAHQHDFADQRFWGYLPCAADVMSNLPFALWGLAGLMTLQGVKFNRTSLGLSALFFIGLIVTAFASSWYHLQPNNAGLAIDRLGMTVAFAGLLGIAAADRASLRAGVILSGLTLTLGSLSVWAWTISGNVLPWLVLQFGGMGLILWLATRQPIPSANEVLAIRWGVVILIYAAAKVLELADHAVYDLTSQLISGHSLKHIVASCAAWPVVSALRAQVIFNKDSVINAHNFGATRI